MFRSYLYVAPVFWNRLPIEHYDRILTANKIFVSTCLESYYDRVRDLLRAIE